MHRVVDSRRRNNAQDVTEGLQGVRIGEVTAWGSGQWPYDCDITGALRQWETDRVALLAAENTFTAPHNRFRVIHVDQLVTTSSPEAKVCVEPLCPARARRVVEGTPVYTYLLCGGRPAAGFLLGALHAEAQLHASPQALDYTSMYAHLWAVVQSELRAHRRTRRLAVAALAVSAIVAAGVGLSALAVGRGGGAG